MACAARQYSARAPNDCLPERSVFHNPAGAAGYHAHMFFLRRPTPEQVQTFLEHQRQEGYTYPEVGQTRDGGRPAGYALDSYTAPLGDGDECFERARAVQSWRMFETPWIRLTNPDAPFRTGETLVVQVRHLGFYSLIPDRVVYTLDEPGRFGFGYGTLSGSRRAGRGALSGHARGFR